MADASLYRQQRQERDMFENKTCRMQSQKNWVMIESEEKKEREASRMTSRLIVGRQADGDIINEIRQTGACYEVILFLCIYCLMTYNIQLFYKIKQKRYSGILPFGFQKQYLLYVFCWTQLNDFIMLFKVTIHIYTCVYMHICTLFTIIFCTDINAIQTFLDN